MPSISGEFGPGHGRRRVCWEQPGAFAPCPPTSSLSTWWTTSCRRSAQTSPRIPAFALTEGSIAADEVLADVRDEYDYVFHLSTYHGNQSSIHDPLADHEHNQLTTLKLFERLKDFERLRKIVYAGAGCAVADKTFDVAPTPRQRTPPISLQMDSPYSISKIVGEFYAVYYYNRNSSCRRSARGSRISTDRARFSAPVAGEARRQRSGATSSPHSSTSRSTVKPCRSRLAMARRRETSSTSTTSCGGSSCVPPTVRLVTSIIWPAATRLRSLGSHPDQRIDRQHDAAGRAAGTRLGSVGEALRQSGQGTGAVGVRGDRGAERGPGAHDCVDAGTPGCHRSLHGAARRRAGGI